MNILPDATLNVLRTFNNIAVDVYGIDCTLYVPNNLNTIESADMYTASGDVTYDTYEDQKIWIEWSPKEIERLRKTGIFAEGEAPILGWFKNDPIVTLKSYVKIPVRYIPDTYTTDEFEVVNVVLRGTYNAEVYRCFKMAPRRVKV
jgi:hypothetical protein